MSKFTQSKTVFKGHRHQHDMDNEEHLMQFTTNKMEEKNIFKKEESEQSEQLTIKKTKPTPDAQRQLKNNEKLISKRAPICTYTMAKLTEALRGENSVSDRARKFATPHTDS